MKAGELVDARGAVADTSRLRSLTHCGIVKFRVNCRDAIGFSRWLAGSAFKGRSVCLSSYT
jgi:hypothetical protein